MPYLMIADRLLALPVYIRLGRKSLSETNTPAYLGLLVSNEEIKCHEYGHWLIKQWTVPKNFL
jgi:hypothetical protein